jgi:Flp pilus assembly protein TadG
MIVRRHRLPNLRGVSAVECAIVFPVTIFLMLGMLVLGLGSFRNQQLQALAREGARYASVHGPNYVLAASGNQLASPSTVQAYVRGLAVDLSGVQCTTVTYSSTSALPSTVSVTLTYTWTPERYFQSMTWTVQSSEIVTY